MMPTTTLSEPQELREYDTFIQVRIRHSKQLADMSMLVPGTIHEVPGIGGIEVIYVGQFVDGEEVDLDT